MVTKRQLEAYNFIYFFDCTQSEAALLMGISQQAVGRLIKRIDMPDMGKNTTPPKMLSYDQSMDCKIKQKF